MEKFLAGIHGRRRWIEKSSEVSSPWTGNRVTVRCSPKRSLRAKGGRSCLYACACMREVLESWIWPNSPDRTLVAMAIWWFRDLPDHSDRFDRFERRRAPRSVTVGAFASASPFADRRRRLSAVRFRNVRPGFRSSISGNACFDRSSESGWNSCALTTKRISKYKATVDIVFEAGTCGECWDTDVSDAWASSSERFVKILFVYVFNKTPNKLRSALSLFSVTFYSDLAPSV